MKTKPTPVITIRRKGRQVSNTDIDQTLQQLDKGFVGTITIKPRK